MKLPWSDAWVLLAILYAGQGRPAPLVSVVAAADFINHAILTFREMRGALARLTAGGWLSLSDGEPAPTEKTLAFWYARKPRRKVFDELEQLRAFLGAAHWDVNEDPPDTAFTGLSQETFDAAGKEYLSLHSTAKTTHPGKP